MRLLACLIAFATLFCAGIPIAAEDAAAQAQRPNVVVVLTDDQRWDTLAAMPTVQRELVRRGVTFSNAFAVNPVCCPSRASFLTGRYSHSTGVYDNRRPHGGAGSFDHRSTLATWLAGAGYRTAYIGKYLNGYQGGTVPSGWHRWVAYSGWHNWVPSSTGFFGYTLSVDGFPATFWYDDASYATDVFTREALAFLAASADPFFLVYAPYAPHAPAKPAPRHADAFADIEPWRARSHNEADVSDKPAWLRNRSPLTEAQEQAGDAFRRLQLASLLAVDDGVGEIVDALAESGRLGNTMIVFTSDNGLLWGEHRLVNRKVAPYEESIRIPFVVRHDALVPGPRTERRLVTNVDLAPTVAELAGTDAPDAEGASLVPLLTGSSFAPPPWRRSFLIEHLEGRVGATAEVPTYCAVRGERYKYVVYATREEELYDLAEDPHELENRAGDPALRQRLLSLRSEVKDLCDPPPPGFSLKWLCTHEGGEVSTVLRGTRRADKFCGGPAREVVYGLGGDDVVYARGGADEVHGGGGADRIVGGPGRDRLNGGAGADVLAARDGERDRITCGRGRDVVTADRGDRVARDCELVRRPVTARAR